MISIGAIGFGVATVISTFIGGQIALKFKNFIKPLIAFCGGTLVAASLLDLIPEALEILEGQGRETVFIFALVLSSFIFFHILDKVVLIHGHSHEEDCDDHPRVSGTFPAIGLIIHSFMDGLIIGAGFLLSFSTGLLVASVVLLHDFSDGLNTVTLLLRRNHTQKTALLFLILDALAPLLGVLAAHLLQPSKTFLGLIFCFFGGFFLYLGATDLLPEAHKDRGSRKLVLFTLLGVVIIAGFRVLVG
jgi:zinc transporter ZupT